MIRRDDTNLHVEHDGGFWTAGHSTQTIGGPASLTVGRDTLLRDCRFYVDDLTPENALVESVRARRESGTAVVETRGYFPFGGQIGFSQVCRYAANHAVIACDVRWPAGATVRRHLGLGTLFLPGPWQRFYCVPPALHLAEGAAPRWREIPTPPEAGSVTVAHWHRPPLALVFERKGGARIEIGTGADVWRWEENLGAGPEAGNYEVVLRPDGIEVVREPLMTCVECEPAARSYRFKWYLAWSCPGLRPQGVLPPARPAAVSAERKLTVVGGEEGDFTLAVDSAALPWPDGACHAPSLPDYIRGRRDGTPCWESSATANLMRALIRQIAGRFAGGFLRFDGIAPSPCWDPAHTAHKAPNGLAHWDVSGLLESATWARHTLGPDWQITAEPADRNLPSLEGLFAPNGFAATGAPGDADGTSGG